MQHLQQHILPDLHKDARGLWDTLTLSDIPAESSTIDLWYGFAQEEGKVIETTGLTGCPIIELTNSLGDFVEEIGGSQRYNLHRKQKRLEKAGLVSYNRATSPLDVEKTMDAFIQLHEMRWAQKGNGGVFQSQSFRMFHREVARIFSERGWVQLDFLLLNNKRIAGIYGYRYNGRYFFYLPGFNPAILPHSSPGILLLFHSIGEAIREGCKEYDLLRGPAEYKTAWANGIRRSLTLRHYNRHIRTAIAKLMDSGKDFVKILVR